MPNVCRRLGQYRRKEDAIIANYSAYVDMGAVAFQPTLVIVIGGGRSFKVGGPEMGAVSQWLVTRGKSPIGWSG